jgi:hypothetical protein
MKININKFNKKDIFRLKISNIGINIDKYKNFSTDKFEELFKDLPNCRLFKKVGFTDYNITEDLGLGSNKTIPHFEDAFYYSELVLRFDDFKDKPGINFAFLNFKGDKTKISREVKIIWNGFNLFIYNLFEEDNPLDREAAYIVRDLIKNHFIKKIGKENVFSQPPIPMREDFFIILTEKIDKNLKYFKFYPVDELNLEFVVFIPKLKGISTETLIGEYLALIKHNLNRLIEAHFHHDQPYMDRLVLNELSFSISNKLLKSMSKAFYNFFVDKTLLKDYTNAIFILGQYRYALSELEEAKERVTKSYEESPLFSNIAKKLLDELDEEKIDYLDRFSEEFTRIGNTLDQLNRYKQTLLTIFVTVITSSLLITLVNYFLSPR